METGFHRSLHSKTPVKHIPWRQYERLYIERIGWQGRTLNMKAFSLV